MLTSTTPFDRRRLQQAAHDEMRRIIREEEPPRPSTRISSLGATATSVAAMRRTDPDRLTRVLRGDLDWIVMKALEKDRTRRYETASSLAEDVWRFLREEPVLARPPSPAYRFQKFARRNKVLLSTAGLVLLSMVAGMAISIWQAVRAASAEALAKERLVAESKAHQDAELARGKAERAWKRATAAEIEAEHHLLRAYLNQARSARVTQRPGQRLESLDALGKAAALAAKLGLRDELGPELRDDLIASLALPVDVREIRRWKLPHQNWFAAVDKQLQRYAYADLEGNLHLCRVQDSSEIAKVAANASPASVHRFSVDGRYLVYHVRHGANGAVWDCEAGRALLEFPLPGDLPSYDLSLDCRTLAAALTDGSIGLYDLPSGALRKTISGVGQIYSLRLDPQLPRVAVTRGRSVEIWDLEEGQRLQSFPHPFWVGRLAWRPDGKLLAVEGGDFNIHVWDVDGEREQAVLHGHINVGIEMSFSPSGRWLASCGWDGTTRIWDPLSGKSHLLAEWMCGDFSADGRHLIFRDGQHVLGIWEFVDSQECVTLATYPKRGKNQNSFAAEICAEGRLLASGGVNGLDLWDLRDGRHLGRYAIGDCYALMFNYQAKSLLTAGSRGLWRWPVSPEVDVVRIGPPIQLDSAATLGMNSASHSAANGYAARIVDSSTIKVFRINNPQEVTAVTHAGGTMVALSADGKWAATGGRVRQAGVKVWDVRNGNLAKDLWPDASDTFPKFSPDGKWLVAGSRSEYRIWSAGTWDLQVLWPREAAANTLGVAAFRADGKCLAIANTRTAVSLLEPSSGQVLASLSSPNTVENIHDLCFHPDGCSLAVVHADSIQLWDLRAIGRQLAALGLDWGLCDPSPDSAAPAPGELPALRVEVDLGPLQGASDASAATPR